MVRRRLCNGAEIGRPPTLKTIDAAPAEPRARAEFFRSLAERSRKLADTAEEAFRRDSYRGFADAYEA